MKIRDKIIETLICIGKEYNDIASDSYIIGASALILLGVDIDYTEDVDILTSKASSSKLKESLCRYAEPNPKTKEDELFKSDFSRYHLPLMDVEVMGDLLVMKDNQWIEVSVSDYKEVSVGEFAVKVPTLEELRRIMLLFGRNKDMQRIELLERYIN